MAERQVNSLGYRTAAAGRAAAPLIAAALAAHLTVVLMAARRRGSPADGAGGNRRFCGDKFSLCEAGQADRPRLIPRAGA